jgi:microcystin-dependent protein
MAVLFANFARTTLASGIAASGAATSLSLTDASKMPNPGAGDYFYLVIQDELKNREIVKVTSRAGNTLTVVRGQESTSIQAWGVNDQAWATITKQGIADIKTEITAAIAAAKEEAITEGALDGYPVGAFIPWGKDGALPDSLLELDGSNVSRGNSVPGAAYTSLFAVYGTYYGVGNGVDTFTLPDLRGRFLRGIDGTSSRDVDVDDRVMDSAPSTAVGDKAGSVQDDAIKKHKHPLGANTGKAGGYETVADPGTWNSGTVPPYNVYTIDMSATADTQDPPNFDDVPVAGETRVKNMSVRWCTKWK